MVTESTPLQFTVDRKAASKLLKVSIRTLDRYVKSRQLSTQLVDGRIWLSKEEILDLKAKKERPVTVDKTEVSTSDVSIDVHVDDDDKVEVVEDRNVHTMSTTPRKKGRGDKAPSVYKKLYEEAKEELQEKQERLEIANYRVGQLEAQVRSSIPMLEYHRENYEKKKREEELQGKINDTTSLLKKISAELRFERLNKRIFVAVLLLILALQPLWLLLIYK